METTIQEILSVFEDPKRFRRGVKAWKRIPAQPGRLVDYPASVDPALREILKKRGIESLYSHQAAAVEAVEAGKNAVIVTPTASGKTLCYTIPVVQRLLEDPDSRALFLFPTKALSQDQMNEIRGVTTELGRDMKVHTFDGDTPGAVRRTIRQAGHIVITNPDMLHQGILPHHTNWIKLFENLQYVVIDEIHHYRGVFGSHLANVLRRLRRICRFYGTKPQFICCSATIANPKEMAEALVGEEFELIDESGAPQGEKHVIFYNPPVVNREIGLRMPLSKEVARIASRFIYGGFQTIVFARTRTRVEVLTTYLKRMMQKFRRNPELVKGYRGGYLPNERRMIEQGIKRGDIIGVVSTNALELGIDIGSLNVSILAGYPGTISSMWQQGGRAGRRRDTAVIILVADSSPLDQFIVQHPEYTLGSSPENGILNPNNLYILASHIKCASFEIPFGDKEAFGDLDVTGILEYLEEERVLRHTAGKYYWMSETYPAQEVSLRSASPENFIIQNTSRRNEVLGEVDFFAAPFMIHDEAIYIHQSQTYHIDQLDWDRRIAHARELESDYYTVAESKTDVRVLDLDERERIHQLSDPSLVAEMVPGKERRGEAAADTGGTKVVSIDEIRRREKVPPDPALRGEKYLAGADLEPGMEGDPVDDPDTTGFYFGEVSVTTIAVGYKKIKFDTLENVGYGHIHLPPQELQTESYWVSFAAWFDDWMKANGYDMARGIHGLTRALHNVAPLFVMCDPRDIGAVAVRRSPVQQRATAYLYDKYPGGIGIAQKVHSLHGEIVAAAHNQVMECACPFGCPSCIGAGLELSELGKKSTLLLLDLLKRA